MDLILLNAILTQEIERLQIPFPHDIVAFDRSTSTAKPTNMPLLVTDSIMCRVVDNKLELFIDTDSEYSEEEIRLLVRHELCHVLDFVKGKIDFNIAMTSELDRDLQSALFVSMQVEIQKAFCEYLMAKRYLRIFGCEEFRIQNEIGMDLFIHQTKETICASSGEAFRRTVSDRRLLAVSLFGTLYALFSEAIKVRFYEPGDARFPRGIWTIVTWLSSDFDFIDSLKINWRAKSALLGLEAVLLFSVVNLETILQPPLLRCSEAVDCGLIVNSFTKLPNAKDICKIWAARYKRLPAIDSTGDDRA